ncbi:hypothetical protein K7X08_001698 [Anisodus acutangulus]|uniref:DUF3456 domain-containing protein n=1 Tax=Anisodus acutangulus TaxID=402998 RepID=A0A9Q1LRJ1_9SOLA|nr:hypothetical protein K7X08_001698 [Anisodus acutangulus]
MTPHVHRWRGPPFYSKQILLHGFFDSGTGENSHERGEIAVTQMAIKEELEHGLLKEKPRNHLDMRHRLDSKGQREGKLIDYRVGELRVVELLEDLCEKMQDYTLEKVDSSTNTWIKAKPNHFISEPISEFSFNECIENRINKQEARAHSKAMSSFCGRLLEQTEDELAELIKKGSVKVGDLCEDVSNYCKGTR